MGHDRMRKNPKSVLPLLTGGMLIAVSMVALNAHFQWEQKAQAQTCPNPVQQYGAVLTPNQWCTAFALKQDYQGSPPPLYSFGSFTPGLTFSGGGTPAYNIQSGSYEEVGRQVTARFTIQTSSLGGGSGGLTITGLPLQSANIANDLGACHIDFSQGWTSSVSATWLSGTIAPNTTTATVYESKSGATSSQVTASELSATTELVGACHYHI